MKEIMLFERKVIIDDDITDCFRNPIDSVDNIRLAKSGDIVNLLEEVQMLLQENSFNDSDIKAVEVALTECCTNAINYSGAKIAQICYRLKDAGFQFTMQGGRTDFNPTILADPRDPINLMKEHGRGLLITAKIMDEMYFCADYSCIRCVRYRGGEKLEASTK